jgi:lysozyme
MGNRKLQSKKILLYVILLSCIPLGLWIFNLVRTVEVQTQFKYIKDFGIQMPVNYKVHGIDVSKFQGAINWRAVKQTQVDGIQIKFAFIKATEGVTITDTRFKRNWEEAKKNHIIRGAYHFFYSTRDPLLQAKNFKNKVTLESGDLAPVLDIEVHNNKSAAHIQKMAKIWLDEMEATYGVKPIIYTSVHFYEKYLGSDFDRYPLWIAHYYQEERPRIQRDWIIWQHSDRGRLPGISTTVDFNVLRGDMKDLMKLCIP